MRGKPGNRVKAVGRGRGAPAPVLGLHTAISKEPQFKKKLYMKPALAIKGTSAD